MWAWTSARWRSRRSVSCSDAAVPWALHAGGGTDPRARDGALGHALGGRPQDSEHVSRENPRQARQSVWRHGCANNCLRAISYPFLYILTLPRPVCEQPLPELVATITDIVELEQVDVWKAAVLQLLQDACVLLAVTLVEKKALSRKDARRDILRSLLPVSLLYRCM